MAVEPDEPASVRAGTGPLRLEIRCPAPYQYDDQRPHQGRLLAVMEVGAEPAYIQPQNLIELACAQCKRRMNAERERGSEPAVARVLHRYDFAGNLVSTLVEMAEPPSDR